jgi:hypothetical protein
MGTVAATEARHRFGAMLDDAQREEGFGSLAENLRGALEPRET